MHARHYLPILLAAIIAVPAPAGAPTTMSPVLPEVSKHLQLAQSDIDSSTFAMARAHARLVLLDPVLQYHTVFQGVPGSQRDKCLKILDSALTEWETQLGGEIHFVRVPDGQPANVVVRFRPSVTMKDEEVAGYVNWKRSIDTRADGLVASNFTADVQIRTQNLDGNFMPVNAMRHACMHEFGHVMGLDDSPKQGNVMGPLDIDHPAMAPSALEVETLRALRSQAHQILDEANGTPKSG